MKMSSAKNNLGKEDKILDQTLRPQKWDEYIGQELTKKNLKILIAAAQERKEPIEHLLFYGPAGLGKTTLAHLIAKELNTQIKVTSGPAIERVGDLASLLTNLTPHDILFIDEAHRLNKMIEEILYPAMESRSLDIIIGKGPSARSIQLELPPFTLIAATTRMALLSSPLRSRFSGGTFRLDFYNQEEIKKIILRSARLLGVDINSEAAEEIAKRSRFTPRIANNLLKRCRDYAQIYNKSVIDERIAEETLKLLEIDEHGLTTHDRQILEILIDKFGGGPIGLQTLSAATSEEIETIEEVYEPYLIQLGFLERTPRGRTATLRAYQHLKKSPPQKPLI
jgi:holliday junction DNA helicase RuvB